jgi:hypothetical protein
VGSHLEHPYFLRLRKHPNFDASGTTHTGAAFFQVVDDTLMVIGMDDVKDVPAGQLLRRVAIGLHCIAEPYDDTVGIELKDDVGEGMVEEVFEYGNA